MKQIFRLGVLNQRFDSTSRDLVTDPTAFFTYLPSKKGHLFFQNRRRALIINFLTFGSCEQRLCHSH